MRQIITYVSAAGLQDQCCQADQLTPFGSTLRVSRPAGAFAACTAARWRRLADNMTTTVAVRSRAPPKYVDSPGASINDAAHPAHDKQRVSAWSMATPAENDAPGRQLLVPGAQSSNALTDERANWRVQGLCQRQHEWRQVQQQHIEAYVANNAWPDAQVHAERSILSTGPTNHAMSTDVTHGRPVCWHCC